MTQTRRTAVLLTMLAIVEGYFLVRYVAFGALFHLFVHGFLGAGLALAAHAVWRTSGIPGGRGGTRTGALEVLGIGVAGHLISALPDVLFLLIDLPHARWMDLIVAHISIHFVPAPLALTFVVFTGGVVAEVLRVRHSAGEGRARTLTLISAGVLVAVLAGGLALRAPLPTTLDDIREDPRIALLCPLGVSDAADPDAEG